MQNEWNDSLLSAYLDDELSGEERAAVEARLRESTEQRQALAELQQLRESFQALPRFELGDDFSARVMAAAVAAEVQAEQQNTASELARMPGAPATTPVERAPASRTSRRLAYVAGAVAAVAACLLVIVQMGGGLSDSPSDVPNGLESNVIASSEPTQPTELPALAVLRHSLPEQGEALVVRVRVPAGTKPADALNVALAQSGIRELAASESTSAGRVGAAYRKAIGGQGKSGPSVVGTSASEALYIEAPLGLVEDALAVLAEQEGGQLDLRPEMKVAVADLPASRSTGEGEGESGNRTEQTAPPEPFAQRLTPRLFRLPEEVKPAVEASVATDAAKIDPLRKVRVLILVETVK